MTWERLEAGSETDNVVDDYRRKTRFLVDENAQAFAQLLHDMGFDALHTSELDLSHRDDTQVLAGAKREGRMLLTQDKDFLDGKRHPLRKSPGVLVLPQDIQKSEVREAILRPLRVLFAHFGNIWNETRIVMATDGSFTMTYIDETGAILRGRYRLTKSDDLEEWIE